MPLLISPHWQTTDNETVKIYHGDVIQVCNALPSRSVHCVVTSPPYFGLRDYKTGSPHELGSEKLHDCLGWAKGINCAEDNWQDGCHVCHMVIVCRAIRRVLRDDGTFWLNYGDSYSTPGENRQGKASKTLDKGGEQSSLKLDVRKGNHNHLHRSIKGLPKGNLVGIPWRVALALQTDGWVLRQEIIWHKPSPMPDSVKNRCTKAHEQIFLLTKCSTGYYYDNEAIKEEAKSKPHKPQNKKLDSSRNDHSEMNKTWGEDSLSNKRSVWTIPPIGYPGAHYATFPPKLIEPCILAGTSEKGCCPDCGASWERFLKATDEYEQVLNNARNGHDWYARSTDNSHKRDKNKKNGDKPTTSATYKTIGWQPRCSCGNSKVIPCTVLDPFLGSGTTAEVAIKNKRRCIGIELSEKYINKNAIPRVCSAIGKYRPTMLELIPD